MSTKSAWEGRLLGTRAVEYSERDAILYALSVGARADELDLVDEERLRVLPTFGLALAQWAPDALGGLGAFDTTSAVHGSQRIEARAPLPRAGKIEMRASVGRVWDKGKAAVFEVDVESDSFRARWSIYAPGAGGFGGERGPSRNEPPGQARVRTVLRTGREQAALYRLNGDLHRIHIDPEAAAAIGSPAPILHGLCTFASTLVHLARTHCHHPADLRVASGRFGAPVLPGDHLTVLSTDDGGRVTFTAGDAMPYALGDGEAEFL